MHTTAAQVIDFAQAARRKHQQERDEWHLTWEEVAPFLAHEILKSKLSYTAIAHQAGLSPSTVSNIASGESHRIQLRTACLLLATLGFDWVVR